MEYIDGYNVLISTPTFTVASPYLPDLFPVGLAVGEKGNNCQSIAKTKGKTQKTWQADRQQCTVELLMKDHTPNHQKTV